MLCNLFARRVSSAVGVRTMPGLLATAAIVTPTLTQATLLKSDKPKPKIVAKVVPKKVVPKTVAKAAPTKKVAPTKKAAPVKKIAAAKKPAPAKKAAPAKKVAPAKKKFATKPAGKKVQQAVQKKATKPSKKAPVEVPLEQEDLGGFVTIAEVAPLPIGGEPVAPTAATPVAAATAAAPVTPAAPVAPAAPVTPAAQPAAPKTM